MFIYYSNFQTDLHIHKYSQTQNFFAKYMMVIPIKAVSSFSITLLTSSILLSVMNCCTLTDLIQVISQKVSLNPNGPVAS